MKIKRETEILDEYYTGEELSELETHVLAGRVDNKITDNKRWLKKGIIKHLKALKSYLFDKNVSWFRKSIVVAALIYFISPIDTMPDFTPFFGFLDDIGVIAWTVKFLGDEIKGYYITGD
ncbi:MAG: DUF1232 domain-containing protein [Ignavibacteriae bacterium]|nr:MAG: DUF1232 domain-containing protein [Ignavibacteriota bacterium]